jgi:putative ABC transport system substrate-binding protein
MAVCMISWSCPSKKFSNCARTTSASLRQNRQGARPDHPADPARPRRRCVRMKRRELITLLGGAAAWPLAARAQQSERMRRIGVLMTLAADDPEAPTRIGAFLQGMQEFGWTIGRNIRIDYRWSPDINSISRYATELAALAPDVILANANPSVVALQRATPSIPIVFVAVTDPVAAMFVESLARPDSNATGFSTGEYGTSGKWLELLKEIAPSITQVGILQDAQNPSSIPQFAAMQSLAPSLGVELKSLPLRDVGEIERIVAAFARGSNLGLIATRIGAAIGQRDLIIALAARHRLPAVYPLRFFVTGGGLVSYGPDIVDQYRRAAAYVDRILKGEKPADLPVQAPVKYELVVNLKAARALSLELPSSVLARADEVIE